MLENATLSDTWQHTQTKTAPRARWLPGLLLCYGLTAVRSVHAVLLLLVDLIGSEGGLGEAVVLPPRNQRRHGGDASGDQLLHGGALDGQDGLAAGAEDLVGQGQQQDSSCLLYTSPSPRD